MIYRHKHFQLDTKSRKVFDQNGKELMITGNAFRLLAFLCEHKNATITEIGEYLDHAKEYTENHIRQYRYKIKSIIGEEIIDYKNSIYSIVGDIETVEKLNLELRVPSKTGKDDRITDLLHPNSLIFGIRMKNISKKPAIIVSILLLLTFFPWAYGYYTVLRWAVSLVSIYYIIGFYSKTKVFDFKIWTLVAIAVLFNPIAPIFLQSKTVWGFFDIIVAGFFVYLIIKTKELK
ncbi:hypothetical protein KKG48_02630 [Patescibacteria group bacterium]|nr:hypothetical protein [Patescibacteria group bacterium]MCG2695005.1 hypothetical protein [Candidatus Parcubacteria bacterium]